MTEQFLTWMRHKEDRRAEIIRLLPFSAEDWAAIYRQDFQRSSE